MVEGGGNENEKERTNEREVKFYWCSVCLRPPGKDGCFGGGGVEGAALWECNGSALRSRGMTPDWFVRFP